MPVVVQDGCRLGVSSGYGPFLGLSNLGVVVVVVVVPTPQGFRRCPGHFLQGSTVWGQVEVVVFWGGSVHPAPCRSSGGPGSSLLWFESLAPSLRVCLAPIPGGVAEYGIHSNFMFYCTQLRGLQLDSL